MCNIFNLESRHVPAKDKTLHPINGDKDAVSSSNLFDKIDGSPKQIGSATKVGKEGKVAYLYLTQRYTMTQKRT